MPIDDNAKADENAKADTIGMSPGAVPAPVLPAGTVLGRYILVGRLGVGGAGLVVSAFDPELERKVAIKLLHAAKSGASPSQGQARLVREAQAMAKLNHPNVMPIFDVGTYQDRVFIAMELVEGGTLRAWLREAKRRPREIVQVFLAAARGLAAAHAAGLVHRDFKPDNVLVGVDGRVRVTDFGLVCASASASATATATATATETATATATETATASATAPAPATPPLSTSQMILAGTLNTPLTRADVIMGTPEYMSPEQFGSRPTDARTDQFSFCVALYEALFGERPFTGANPIDLAHAVTAGKLRDPPRGVHVPGWLRRLLARGLRPEPEQRFPSMASLIAALEADPALRRRQLLVAAASLATLTAVALGAQHWSQRHTQLCTGAERKLDGVWDAALKARVQAAFARSGAPSAARLWSNVSGALDGYARDWAAMHTEACQATRVRGEQPESVLALRITCLDGRLRELGALTGIFAAADAPVVLRSAEAAAAVSSLRACADVATLRAPVPPPDDAATRVKVDALRGQLAQAKALLDAGRYPAGLALATTLVAQAEPLRYAPLLAETLAVRGRLLMETGDYKQADQVLRRTYKTAYAGRDDRVAARAAIEEIEVVGYWLARHADGHEWADFAEAATQRIGGADELTASRLYKDAWIYIQEGDGARAVTMAREALERGERAFGPRSVTTAMLHGTLGGALDAAKQYDEARKQYGEELRIVEQAVGPEHPLAIEALNQLACLADEEHDYAAADHWFAETMRYATATLGANHPKMAVYLSNYADTLRHEHKLVEALAIYQRAAALNAANFPPDHPDSVYPLRGIGRTLLDLGRPAEALPPLERALAVSQGTTQDPSFLGRIRFAIARALTATHGDRARAQALAAAARLAFAKGADSEDLAEVDAWLARAR